MFPSCSVCCLFVVLRFLLIITILDLTLLCMCVAFLAWGSWWNSSRAGLTSFILTLCVYKEGLGYKSTAPVQTAEDNSQQLVLSLHLAETKPPSLLIHAVNSWWPKTFQMILLILLPSIFSWACWDYTCAPQHPTVWYWLWGSNSVCQTYIARYFAHRTMLWTPGLEFKNSKSENWVA